MGSAIETVGWGVDHVPWRALGAASAARGHGPSTRCGSLFVHSLLAGIALVVAGRPVAEAAPPRHVSPPGTVRIALVGDIMLDGGPGHAFENGTDPFAATDGLLLSADITVGNLECVLGRGGSQVLKPYTFRGPAAAATTLARYFSALSVANNHSLDFGPDGLTASLEILAGAGVPAVGGGPTLAAARRPLVLERNGLRVALLAANGFRPEESAASATTAGVAPLVAEDLLADVAAARREADVVVPFVHWGPELVAQPREVDRLLARRLIDAGASAVVGAHPHVTQTVDTHAGRPIVYSLGNFVFDYFPGDPAVWTGWVAILTCRADGTVDLETHAVELDRTGLPHPVRDDD